MTHRPFDTMATVCRTLLLQAGSGQVTPHMEKLRVQMEERTEKLQETERRAEEMAQNGENFANAASELADHYANKKWWEL
jgi:hypothetical protein